MEREGVHKLLAPLIAGMNKTIFISSIVTAGMIHQLNTSNTLWYTYNQNQTTLTIGATDYTVTEVKTNQYIKVTHPTDTPTETQFDIPVMFFAHGTINSVSAEMTEKLKSWENFPLVFQHDATKENYDNDQFSSIDREVELDLYFLKDADFPGWSNEDHENNAVTPMRNAVDSFINYMASRADLVLPDFTYQLFNRVRFGSEIENGYDKMKLTTVTSGIQMKLNCSFKRPNCTC